MFHVSKALCCSFQFSAFNIASYVYYLRVFFQVNKQQNLAFLLLFWPNFLTKKAPGTSYMNLCLLFLVNFSRGNVCDQKYLSFFLVFLYCVIDFVRLCVYAVKQQYLYIVCTVRVHKHHKGNCKTLFIKTIFLHEFFKAILASNF